MLLAAVMAATVLTAPDVKHPLTSAGRNEGPRAPGVTFTAAQLDDATVLARLRAVEAAHLHHGQRLRGARGAAARRAPRVAANPTEPPAAPSGIPDVWRRLVECEAHGDWRMGAPGHPRDPGYDFDGGPQFAPSTWTSHAPAGYPRHAYDASPSQQLVVARRVLAEQGVTAWPQCGPRVGLRRGD